MTELALHQDAAPSIISKAGADLVEAARIAEVLVRTSFAPAHFRGKPEEGTVAILYGAAVGMDPMAAIQNIYVISGKPALYAKAMVGIVQSKGHDIWTEEAGPTKVVVCGRRKGSDKVERSEWTIERARKAGYTSNKKYDTEPESMLYARASGDVSRRVAQDALMGMSYNVEELQMQPQDPIVAPSTRTDRLREAIAAPQPAAAVPALPTGSIDTGQDVEPITAPQLKKLHASLGDAKLGDRDAGLAYISQIVGRDIDTSKALSKDEASRVIEALAQDAAEPVEPTLDGLQ